VLLATVADKIAAARPARTRLSPPSAGLLLDAITVLSAGQPLALMPMVAPSEA